MFFTQLEVNGYVLAEQRPVWLNDDGFTRKHYEDILPLIDFYVFDNPSGELSARKRPIEDYGWINPWKKPIQLNYKMKDESNNRFLYYSADSLQHMQGAIERAGLFKEVSFSSEVACFYDNISNQSLSCLYHIRDSLCHGRFLLKEDSNNELWLLCEDISNSRVKNKTGKKLSARMVLKLSTLYAWKQLITTGPIE